jgi:hypothetical protein
MTRYDVRCTLQDSPKKAVPYVRASLCNSCRMAKARGRGQADWLKGLVMSIVSNLFLFQNKALAQLDHSNVLSRLLDYRLNLMTMHPGFLRAGQHSDNFVCFNTSGIECPTVLISCSGEIVGITTRLCNSATLI